MEALITLSVIALFFSFTVFSVLSYSPYAGFSTPNPMLITWVAVHVWAILLMTFLFVGLWVGETYFGVDNNLTHPHIHIGTLIEEGQEPVDLFRTPSPILVHVPFEAKVIAGGLLLIGFVALGVLWASVPLPTPNLL
jgi:hypothetical protein